MPELGRLGAQEFAPRRRIEVKVGHRDGVADQSLMDEPIDAQSLLTETVRFWRAWAIMARASSRADATAFSATCSVARWSPDNTKIACVSNTTISMLDADGSNLRTIGSYSSPVGALIWAPDGGGLRFALYDPYRHDQSLWDVPLGKGTTSTPSLTPGLPRDGTCCIDFAWMPDGKTFIYVTLDANRRSHLMAQIDGSSREVELPTKTNEFGGLAPAKNALYLRVAGTSRGELLRFDRKQNVFQVYRPELSAGAGR
jgi:Tol biopolymer transport system component